MQCPTQSMERTYCYIQPFPSWSQCNENAVQTTTNCSWHGVTLMQDKFTFILLLNIYVTLHVGLQNMHSNCTFEMHELLACTDLKLKYVMILFRD